MKNEALYNKTVDILVQAYFNDTLENGNCYACAVGNLIAANCGYSFEIVESDNYDSRKNVWTGRGSKYWLQLPDFQKNPVRHLGLGESFEVITPEEIELLLKTGYNIQDCDLIERAFETIRQGDSTDAVMFNGLMAVIDALDIIHENTSTEITTETKSKFVKLIAHENL